MALPGDAGSALGLSLGARLGREDFLGLLDTLPHIKPRLLI